MTATFTTTSDAIDHVKALMRTHQVDARWVSAGQDCQGIYITVATRFDPTRAGQLMRDAGFDSVTTSEACDEVYAVAALTVGA